MNRKVHILGCGPAGLMAAHAAYRSGWEPVILAGKVERSILRGAQYLHEPIPGLPESLAHPETIFYRYIGIADNYALKVYGDQYAPTSWGKWNGEQKAWDLVSVYDWLWGEYALAISETWVEETVIRDLLQQGPVISSIPRSASCANSEYHVFAHEITWIDISPRLTAPENEIVYNGSLLTDWTRASNLFGAASVEYCGFVPGREAVPVRKPTLSSCECWPDMLYVGRHGTWNKRTLSHQAYEDTLFYLQESR